MKHSWCRTTSSRTQYFEKTLEMCGLVDDPDHPINGHHRDLEHSEIVKSEEAVQRVLTTIRSFTNPFEIPDKQRLYNLSSGAPVPEEVENDVLQAEEFGRGQRDQFIQERFVNGQSDKLFFEPVKKLKLRTMEVTNKQVKLTTSEGKVVQYREQSDLAFTLLIKSQLIDNPISFDELMHYPLMSVPPVLGTPDGYFAKTNKAAPVHFIMEEFPNVESYPQNAFHVEDGNALIHMLKNLPPTFGQICQQIIDQMSSKSSFIFSTDSYMPNSIKAQERVRRGCSPRFNLGGPSTRKPPDFKLFLCNDDNKTQLFQLLLEVAKSKDTGNKLPHCKGALFVVEGSVYKIKNNDDGNLMAEEVPELYSNQEETDTRIFLYLPSTKGQPKQLTKNQILMMICKVGCR